MTGLCPCEVTLIDTSVFIVYNTSQCFVVHSQGTGILRGVLVSRLTSRVAVPHCSNASSPGILISQVKRKRRCSYASWPLLRWPRQGYTVVSRVLSIAIWDATPSSPLHRPSGAYSAFPFHYEAAGNDRRRRGFRF